MLIVSNCSICLNIVNNHHAIRQNESISLAVGVTKDCREKQEHNCMPEANYTTPVYSPVPITKDGKAHLSHTSDWKTWWQVFHGTKGVVTIL